MSFCQGTILLKWQKEILDEIGQRLLSNIMDKDEILQRIARYLMLYTSHQNNLGLLNGKMGVVIFFFHYATYTERDLYNDFAEELINEIYREIQIDHTCDFKDGLSGIAWGMEYLARKRFVEGDTDEVLEELDKQILKRDVRYIRDNTLETGLKGLAYYTISRCVNRMKSNKIISEEYISDLIKSLQFDVSKNSENAHLITTLKRILACQSVIHCISPIDCILKRTTIRYKNLFQSNRALGISNNGYAGMGLKIIKDDESKKKNIYIQ